MTGFEPGSVYFPAAVSPLQTERKSLHENQVHTEEERDQLEPSSIIKPLYLPVPLSHICNDTVQIPETHNEGNRNLAFCHLQPKEF